jgi:hypothetical protein
MATRHRIPSIFTLSMVDVLCCALGCVILLWLLNLRQARQSGSELTDTQKWLEEEKLALRAKRAEAEELTSKLASALHDRDDLAAKLRAAKKSLAAIESELASLKDERDSLQADLTRSKKVGADAQKRGNDLELMLKKKETEAQASARSVRELEIMLKDAEDRSKKLRLRGDDLEKDLALRGKELAGSNKSLTELENLRIKLTRDLAARDKELATATLSLDRAREDKVSLIKQAGRLKSEMESRFAGIALTGKKVVFLVDMSGSMELVDPRTADPNKWVGVRETLTKVMKSLPSLEKYQVILFSDKVLYPLGKEGEWFDYEGVANADSVLKTLAEPKFKPKGGTNMYAAFDAAFRYRASGLDTIYLLSDGLPNQGEGITAEQKANLGEIEKGEILGKYIRKTLANDWNRPLERRPKVRINAIGFFYESPDVGAFLWALARENDGSFVGMSKP